MVSTALLRCMLCPAFFIFQPLPSGLKLRGSKKNLYFHPSGSIGNTLYNWSFVGFKLVILVLLLTYDLGVNTLTFYLD